MSKSNIFLVALCLLLGGFYWWYDVKEAPKRAEAEKQSKRFFPNLKKDQLASVSVENLRPAAKDKDKPKKRQFLKKHGVWVEDMGAEQHVMATMQMGQISKTLVELSQTNDFASPTPGSNLNPADFGLDKPHWKIELRTADGTSYAINLGDQTPDTSGFYAQVPGGPVASIVNTLKDILETPEDQMRERSPVVYKSSTVNKIALTLEDGKKIAVEIAKPREKPKDEIDESMEITDLTEEWKLTAPHEGPADGQKVRDLFYNWKSVKFGRFLKADEKIDFSKPALRFEATVDGEAEPYVFEVGPVVPAKPNMRYLRRLNPEETMVIEMANPKPLDIHEDSFDQRHVAVFEPDSISRIDAKIKDQAIAGKRKDRDWTMSQPSPSNPDQASRNAAVSDLLFELKNMEWKSKSSESNFTETAAFHLFNRQDKPAAQISLGQESGKGRLVKVEGSNEIWVVEPDPLARLESVARRIKEQVSPTPTPAASAAPGATGALPIMVQNGKPVLPNSSPTPLVSASPTPAVSSPTPTPSK